MASTIVKKARALPGDPRVYGLGLALLIVGAPLGFSILPNIKFSGANVCQVIAFFLIAVYAFHYIGKCEILVFSSYIVGLAISWIFLHVELTLSGSIMHDLYFAVCIVCLLCVWAAPKSKALQLATNKSLRVAVPATLAIMYCYALYDMGFQHLAYTSMGFDDKSHAAVFVGCLAFAPLFISQSFVRIPISMIVFATSFLTASRLSAVMIPLYLVALIVEFMKTRNQLEDGARRKFDIAAGSLIAVISIIALIIMFKLPIASRILTSLQGGDAASSTKSHILLIKFALQLKFSHPWIFIFGSSPGLFSYLLPKSNLDFEQLGHYDPGAFAAMWQGALPVHSSLASIFLEFPIWLFALYIYILFKSGINLAKTKQISVLMMLCSLILSTVWYSGHNEPYFLSILLITLSSMGPVTHSGKSKSSLSRQLSKRHINHAGSSAAAAVAPSPLTDRD